MTLTFWKRSALAAGLLFFAPALAQQPAPRQPQAAPKAKETKETKERSSPLAGFGANGKEPIKIDSDRLDVFDRDGRAVFTGNVVAVQGDSTIRCSIMTVFYEQNRAQAQAGGGQPRPANAAAGSNDSAIKKIDCQGPVTVVSKTQTATGDKAVYDKADNKVVITGSVALADGTNVMRGERIVYDLDSGVANVDPKVGERVKVLITPGSGSEASAKPEPKPEAKPEPAKASPPAKPKPQARPASAQAN
jgi:lipopolysaccharide export system protein LptA